MMIVSLSMLILAAKPPSPHTPPQNRNFDLSCTGSTRTINAVKETDETQTIIQYYRIDLDAMKYCSAMCPVLHPISTTTGSKVVFERPISNPRAGQSFTRHWFDGKSGRYFNLVSGDVLSSMTEAVCTQGAFTGFPAARPKWRRR